MPSSIAVQTLHSERSRFTASHVEYLARGRIDCMDGLRAIGILAVVHQHAMHGAGRLGASLFLLLSGYLVTTLLLREQSSTGTIDLTRFATRRCLRLFPLYFAVLASYVLLVWLLESDGSSRTQFFTNLPAFATLTSNLLVPKGEHVIFFFAWTMAAQEQFHFVWSRILKYAGKKIAFGGLVSTLFTLYVVGFLGVQPNAQRHDFFWTIVLSLKPTLLLGALIAIVLSHRLGFAIMSKLVSFRFAPLVFLTAVVVVWRVKEIPDCFMHLFLMALLASCVVPKSHSLTWLLQNPCLVFVGSISFGIYMTHLLCFHVVAKMFHSVGLESICLQFVLTFLLAVGVATLSNRYFENLFVSRKKSSLPHSASPAMENMIHREPSVQKAITFVDLDPILADLAETLEASDSTSVQRRIEALKDGVDSSGGTNAERLGIEAEEWSRVARDFGRTFKNVAGKPVSIEQARRLKSRRRLYVSRN